MKSISLAFVIASLLTLNACGDGSENSDLNAVTSITANSVRIDQAQSRFTCGGSTRLEFGGIDAAGHATFSVITSNANTPDLVKNGSCDLAPKLFFPGLKLRVKGITLAGSWSTFNGAFGNIEVTSGPRTAFTRTATQFFSGVNPNFLKPQSYPVDKFTNCGDSTLGEILMTRPGYRINGGTAGKIPSASINLREIRISLDVAKC